MAALAVAAYGRENVYGVLMPNGVQPDIDYSQALVEHLQIPHCTINIHDAVQGVLQEMEKAGLTPSRQTAVNLPSRVRMATLYAVAQTLPAGIVINTSNLSEDWVGYCTITATPPEPSPRWACTPPRRSSPWAGCWACRKSSW